ncbi:MAG: hypothetical protein ACF8OB_02370 [Phycisphaeraceae bacterium JB051]
MFKTKCKSLWIIQQLTFGLGLLLICSVTWAQPVDPAQLAADPESAGVEFAIDTYSLLTSDELLVTSIDGPVWTTSAKSSFGKILLQVPILLQPGDKPVEISNSYLKVARGRFICYRLDDFGPTAELLEQAGKDKRQVDAGNRRDAREADMTSAPPVITKKFVLLPNGKVQYAAATVVNNQYCEVSDYSDGDSLYKLKIGIRQYQEMRPQVPERPSDRSREAQLAFQATYNQYRNESAAYRELGKRARALPKDIEIDKPTRIWAVFEVDETFSDLSVTGPKPLPWDIKTEVLNQLRDISGTQATAQADINGVQRLSVEHTDAIILLAKLIEKRHPYDLQLASLVVSMTNMVGYANLGDTQFFLLKAILESKDKMARDYIMAELRQTIPPTSVTLELAKLVVVNVAGDAKAKTQALTSMLAGLKSNPGQAASTAETINAMLANEDGAAPATLLRPLFEATREDVDMRTTFIQSIRFQSLPETRLNDALVYIVENAGAEPLAAGWLNEHFLGSANPSLLIKTLTVIAEADTGARDLGPMFNWAVNKLFGQPTQSAQSTLRKARMRLPIPILTPYDGIYRALQHGNSDIRNLAWRSLPRFTIPPLAEGVAALDKESDRYQILTNTALDMLTTPSGIVTFLERQPNKMRVAECLLQIVLRGSTQVQVASVRALIGCKAPLGNVMLDMSPGDRQGFAMFVYDLGANVSPPLVVNVLRRREANNPVARWFGDEVAKGEIPSTSAWINQFESEGQLLELVASNDEALAKGAAAVMISAIGGRDRDALAFREKVRLLPDQTEASVAQAWSETKKGLFASQLKRYEGHYRLALFIAEGDDYGGQLNIPMREISVGVVQFRIDETTKTLSLTHDQLEPAIGEDYHSITIGKPAELANFPNDELKEVPLKNVTMPVKLSLDENGFWKGSFTIGDGAEVRKAQLRLIPVKAGATAQ